MFSSSDELPESNGGNPLQSSSSLAQNIQQSSSESPTFDRTPSKSRISIIRNQESRKRRKRSVNKIDVLPCISDTNTPDLCDSISAPSDEGGGCQNKFNHLIDPITTKIERERARIAYNSARDDTFKSADNQVSKKLLSTPKPADAFSSLQKKTKSAWKTVGTFFGNFALDSISDAKGKSKKKKRRKDPAASSDKPFKDQKKTFQIGIENSCDTVDPPSPVGQKRNCDVSNENDDIASIDSFDSDEDSSHRRQSIELRNAWKKKISPIKNKTAATILDSAQKRRRLVKNGLAMQLHRVLSHRKSELAFWRHRLGKEEGHSVTLDQGTLVVRIMSTQMDVGLLVALCALKEERLHVIFSSDSHVFQALLPGALIAISPPFHTIQPTGISGRVLLCASYHRIMREADQILKEVLPNIEKKMERQILKNSASNQNFADQQSNASKSLLDKTLLNILPLRNIQIMQKGISICGILQRRFRSRICYGIQDNKVSNSMLLQVEGNVFVLISHIGTCSIPEEGTIVVVEDLVLENKLRAAQNPSLFSVARSILESSNSIDGTIPGFIFSFSAGDNWNIRIPRAQETEEARKIVQASYVPSPQGIFENNIFDQKNPSRFSLEGTLVNWTTITSYPSDFHILRLSLCANDHHEKMEIDIKVTSSCDFDFQVDGEIVKEQKPYFCCKDLKVVGNSDLEGRDEKRIVADGFSTITSPFFSKENTFIDL
eukprot:UC4_evm4s59